MVTNKIELNLERFKVEFTNSSAYFKHCQILIDCELEEIPQCDMVKICNIKYTQNGTKEFCQKIIIVYSLANVFVESMCICLDFELSLLFDHHLNSLFWQHQIRATDRMVTKNFVNVFLLPQEDKLLLHQSYQQICYQ